MPGFTERERHHIANLCRYHRKSPPNAAHSQFQALDAEGKRAVVLLTPLLRLADALDRSDEQRVQSLECQIRDGDVLMPAPSHPHLALEHRASNHASTS